LGKQRKHGFPSDQFIDSKCEKRREVEAALENLLLTEKAEGLGVAMSHVDRLFSKLQVWSDSKRTREEKFFKNNGPGDSSEAEEDIISTQCCQISGSA
jgi:hypothetical protein